MPSETGYWNRDTTKDIIATVTCTRDSSKDSTLCVYTQSSTPAVGDTIYNEQKESTGKTIKSVSGDTITWSDITPETITFNYTGAVQTYTVPAGVGHLIVDAVGGGSSNNSGIAGKESYGGRVQTKLTVTPGQVLNIYVGGGGSCTYVTSEGADSHSGWNGGGAGLTYYIGTWSGVLYYAVNGGGGGATDIRIGGEALEDRKVVAGGAGGAGFTLGDSSGVITYFVSARGGNGGGLIGEEGENFSLEEMESFAKGGTQSSGGDAAVANRFGTFSGNPGSFGYGGSSKSTDSDYYAAGGGAGYYGGGSGVYSSSGGGGSSYTDPVLCTDVVHTQGYSLASGNGWLTITTAA